MSCCCWHGHCHCHGGYGYTYGPPPYEAAPYGPPARYGPPPGAGFRRRRRMRPGWTWEPDEEELAAYLRDLEDQVGQVRQELEELRRARGAEEG